MFDRDYPAADVVNTSVSCIGDHTLEAEIMRHRSTMARLDVNQQKQKTLKLEQERLELTLGMCQQRLQDARACNRVLCYTLTGCSSRREVSLSGVGSGLSALATCNAGMW